MDSLARLEHPTKYHNHSRKLCSRNPRLNHRQNPPLQRTMPSLGNPQILLQNLCLKQETRLARKLDEEGCRESHAGSRNRPRRINRYVQQATLKENSKRSILFFGDYRFLRRYISGKKRHEIRGLEGKRCETKP